tara:strand:+ start:3412 stop:4047 length:636 start_codon:yes stop_codon:yes gene_type:complete
MNLPTEQQCQELFQKYKVPQNIKQHCEKVREVAVFLAEQLKNNGEEVNIGLVSRAALLHDLFKVVTIDPNQQTSFHQGNFSEAELLARTTLIERFPNMKEHQIAYQFFKDDYPLLASVLLTSSNLEQEKDNWEDIIICYADSRTFQNQVVSQKERFKYLKQHYPKPIEFWDNQIKKLSEYENNIFSKININPKQLAEKIVSVSSPTKIQND